MHDAMIFLNKGSRCHPLVTCSRRIVHFINCHHLCQRNTIVTLIGFDVFLYSFTSQSRTPKKPKKSRITFFFFVTNRYPSLSIYKYPSLSICNTPLVSLGSSNRSVKNKNVLAWIHKLAIESGNVFPFR